MSSTNPATARGEPIAREVRPLPDAPSLEYERKEAKALLRQVALVTPPPCIACSRSMQLLFAIAALTSSNSPMSST
jgi:hypothetical protein